MPVVVSKNDCKGGNDRKGEYYRYIIIYMRAHPHTVISSLRSLKKVSLFYWILSESLLNSYILLISILILHSNNGCMTVNRF